jgi:uncharacterized protein
VLPRGSHSASAISDTLEAVGKQRTAEARGGAARRDRWIPDNIEEAKAAGLDDMDLLDAVKFYSERRPAKTRTNRRDFRSLGPLMSSTPSTCWASCSLNLYEL